MIDHKKVKINEFLPFPWESNVVTTPSKKNTEISNDDIKRLKQLEKQWS